MKLHLPKTLLAAVLAVGFAMPPAFAEGESQTGSIGNSYDAKYTYAGNVYTMSATAKNDTLSDMYETTRDATDPSSWTQSDTATTTGWAQIHGSNTENGNNPYNTLRIVAGTQYGFKFNNMSIGSLIVEESGDGAKIYSFSSADRNIYYGKSGLTADSYFAGSFTLDNTNANAGIDITIAGTQNWHIVGGKTVSLVAKDEIINNGTWNISGGTVSVNGTVNNTGGTLSLKDGAGLHVDNLNNLTQEWDLSSATALTANGSTQLSYNYYVVKGGTSNVSSVTYQSGEETITKNLTNNSYFADVYDAYGVVSNTTVADIKDVTEGIVFIKEGASVERGDASFASAKQLAGDGTYDLGNLGKGNWPGLTGNVSLHDTWTGTISLSGGEFSKDTGNNDTNNSFSVKGINFNNVGNANSTVEIAEAGLYGYFTGNGNTTTSFNPNILLTGDLTIQNANSKTTHKFLGKISGDGNIIFARTGGTPCAYTFTNDISGWKGSLLNTKNYSGDITTNINLEGQATEVNATIDALAILTDDNGTQLTSKGGYLNLFVKNAGKTTTFNKNVTVSLFESTSAVALGEGVKLTLVADNNEKISSISSLNAHANGNIIELQSDATLSRIATKSGGDVSMIGLGTYDLENISSNNAANVKFGADWKGTVVITNSQILGSNLNNYGNANSTIKLVGYNGWMNRDNAASTYGADGTLIERQMGNTILSKIVLENYSATDAEGNVTATKSAFIFDDHSENETYTLAGAVSGSGDFQIASDASVAGNIMFTGSTGDWKGGIIATNAYNPDSGNENNTPTMNVYLTGGGNIFSAEGNKGFVMDRASTNANSTNIINLNIGHTSNDSTMNGVISMGENADENAVLNLAVKGNTTFKKDVQVSSLTVDANKTATLEGATTTGTLTGTGAIEVTGANAKLTQTGTADTTLSSLTLTDGATYEGAGATNITNLVLSTGLSDTKAAVSTSGALTLGTVSIDLTGYTAGDYILATTVNNLTYDANMVDWTNLADGMGAELRLLSTNALDGTSGTTNTLVLTLTQPQSDTLTEVTVSSGSYADGVLTLQTNVDDATAVAFGSTLNAKMSDTVWDSILEQYGKEMGDLVKVSFADANGTLLDFGDNGETQMTITINGEVTRDGNLAVTKPTLSGDGTIVGNYVTAYIPEPTSTTLSILALAALAVRRRRR